MKKLIFLSLFIIAGCGDVYKKNCVNLVQESYCKPTTMASSGAGTVIVYDCSGVNSSAYDAAIKSCIEAKQ